MMKRMIATILAISFIFIPRFSLAKAADNIDLNARDEIVPKVIENVSPSVVAIIGNYKTDDTPSYLENFDVGTIHGSGVVIGKNEILTNEHVAVDMINITVVFSDGSYSPGRLKCADELTDLAIITVDRNDLVPIKFGKKEDIVTGKTVIAVGTPVVFSLRNSATLGIISGLNRSIESEYRLIQTDAAINPGNSGGPLLNMRGELIGINSYGYAGFGIESLGFAIPVDTVEYVINNFRKYSKVLRPIVGMTFEEPWEAKIGLPTKRGIIVSTVEPDGPAYLAGIREDDIILAANGADVRSTVDFNEIMKEVKMGDEIKIHLSRDEQGIDVIVHPDF